MKKQLLTPKRAEELQRQIYYHMPDEKKFALFSKINDKVHKIAIERAVLKYPNIERISVAFVNKLHGHIDLERDYYNGLFNKFLEGELKSIK